MPIIKTPGKEKNNPATKYLKASEFVDFCNANKVATSLDELEAYERCRLFYPCYRIIAPDDYITELFKFYHETIHSNPSATLKIKSEWRKLHDLRDALSQYASLPEVGHFKVALKKGHPLDCAYKQKSPFVFKPEQQKFIPWGTFKIVGGSISGQPSFEQKAWHYYAEWQIFVLYNSPRNSDRGIWCMIACP